MAKLHKYSANERASIEVATEWTVSARLDISSAAHAYKALGERTLYITVWPDLACYYRFDTGLADTISANNDPIIPADTLTRIKVPKGVPGSDDTLYVHFKATSSSATQYVRLVEE